MKKKVLSAFMALALCLTLLPAAAWAEETDAHAQSGTDDTVYSVDPDAAVQSIGANANAVENAVAEVTASDGTVTQYASLNDAVSAAQGSTGATVKLLADVTTTSPIAVSSGTFTLDLNGKELSRDTGYTLWVRENGNVTVTSTQSTGTINSTGGSAIYVAANAAVHVTNRVRLNQLYAMDTANLTLDVGVIITATLHVKNGNIAPFLTGKALQACDEQGNTTKDTYVSIYKNYDTGHDSTGCVIVIEHEKCEGTPSQGNPCEICGYDGTQTKPTEPTEPVDPNVAEVNNQKYERLAEAIRAANGADITLLRVFGENVVVNGENSKASIILGNGDTVEGEGTYPSYWIADSNGIPLTMNAGEITLKAGVLAQFSTGANNNIAIKLNGGTLTVADTVTKIIGGSVDITSENTAQMAAIEATGGTLDLQGSTLLDGGLSISGDAQLAHKLKAGIFTNSGSTTASVSVEGNNYTTVFDLLAEGYAFAKYDTSKENNAGEIVNGYVNKITEDVIVVAHPKHTMTLDSASGTYTCACGFVCPHNSFTNGKCTVCDYECMHPSAAEAADGKYTCNVCKEQMAVKVEKDNTTTYYAKHHEDNEYAAEDTLKQVFNTAADGSTITLLADGMYAFAGVTGKTITLNLNGKNLIENNGLVVESKNGTAGKLIVTGSGSSKAPEPYLGICTFRVWDGGTLVFSGNFSGTFGRIYVHGGTLTSDSTDMTFDALEIQNSGATISLKGGTFGKITCSGSKALGDLLPPEEQGRKSGKAFKHIGENGAFVPYDTTITSDGVKNVTITDCPHDSIKSGPNSDDITCGTCTYCGMDNIAAVLTTMNGDIEAYTLTDGTADLFGGLTNNGGTLKLYSGLTFNDDLGTQGGTTEMVIDLNGHTISLSTGATGLKVTLNGGTLTIQDSGSTKGKFASPLNVAAGAKLIVDGAAVGKIIASDKTAKITLKAGTTFTEYSKPAGMPLADWIEDGCCIKDGETYLSLSYAGTASGVSGSPSGTAATGAYTVTKASATITASNKSGEIKHSGFVPTTLLPTITPAGTTPASYRIEWYRRADTGTKLISACALKQDRTFDYYTKDYKDFKDVTAGDTLKDVFCIIKAYEKASTEGNILWQTAVKGYTLTVTKGTATVTQAPTAVENLTYNGSAQELVTAGSANGGTMQYSLDGKTWQDKTIPTGTDAGEYTVYYRAKGNANLDPSEPQSIKVTIAPKTVAEPTIVVDSGSVYDGKAKTPTVTVKDGDTTIDQSEYTVSYSDNTNAGEATVTITDKEGGNYTVSGNATFSIQKATAPSNRQSDTLKIANNHAATYTYDVSALLPKLESGREYGTVTYTVSWSATDSNYAAISTTIDKSGLLTLSVNAVNSTDQKLVGSVTVTVTSTNYDNFTLLVNVNAVNKLVATGEPTLSKTTLTYGERLSSITLSGAMQDGEATVQGTFAWTQPDAAPAAGSYAAEWKFTPADSSKYMEITGTADVAVNKATPSGAPKYTAITTSGKKLADAALTTVDGTFSVPGTVAWELPDTTEVTANTAYKWVFTPTDTDNYNEISDSITLYSVSTGGGGGGGSTTTKTETTTNPDGSTTKTETKSDGTVVETTTNKDGSSTKTESKTETKSDGSTVETVTETRTEADGSKTTGKMETVTAKDGTKTETKTETSTAKDGTKTETKSETKTETDGTKTETKSETTTAKDGSKTETKSETKTDANGVTSGTETSTTTAANGSTGTTTTVIENGVSKTEAEAKISDKAVSDAKKSDEAVKIPTEVKAGGDSASAPTVKIDLPKNSGETKIEIPVKDVSAGTVAVIVHPDGTEELIKESLPTEGGVQLTVDGSVTVKIVDNAKDFKDTKNHWAADSIDFVSARGLVNGTGSDSFDPNTASTRAQLWTILARQSGADLTGGASWYEKAQEWAKTNGISDGSAPNSSITRAQMVTMLWRAAGSPKADGANAFNDVPTGSYYADAIAWAAAHGITTGVGNGAFDPNGTCTRAQIAAFLHRSYLSE